MGTHSIQFNEVAIQGTKTCRCAVCNKKITRKKKFCQSLNPWNKNSKGEPKSSNEIYAELSVERDAWAEEIESCRKCLEQNQQKETV